MIQSATADLKALTVGTWPGEPEGPALVKLAITTQEAVVEDGTLSYITVPRDQLLAALDVKDRRIDPDFQKKVLTGFHAIASDERISWLNRYRFQALFNPFILPDEFGSVIKGKRDGEKLNQLVRTMTDTWVTDEGMEVSDAEVLARWSDLELVQRGLEL